MRGIGTWNGDAQPLYVVDGQIIEPPRAGNEDAISGAGLSTPPNLFNLINPGDIESISVLKDASAAAIYGNRGAQRGGADYHQKGKTWTPGGGIQYSDLLFHHAHLGCIGYPAICGPHQ